MAFNAKGIVPQPFRWCKPAGSLFLLLALSCFVGIARPGQRLEGEAAVIRDGTVAHAAERGVTKANEAEDKPDWVKLRRFLFTVLPPWLVVSLLAIHYGHFLWIKKVGNLLLTLLATMTVIAFVASGARWVGPENRWLSGSDKCRALNHSGCNPGMDGCFVSDLEEQATASQCPG
jgi:hypothetical protein